MTTNTQEHASTWDDGATRPGILTNSCLTEGGQLTCPGVYFAQFTLARHLLGERELKRELKVSVGAATADPDQLRWTK